MTLLKKWNSLKSRDYLKGYKEGFEDAKRFYADKDFLDLERGKITFNEYRMKKGFSPIIETKE